MTTRTRLSWRLATLGLASLAPGGAPIFSYADESTEKDRFGPAVESAALVDAGSARIGQLIEDVSFIDIDERAGKLSDYSSNKALVIAFRSSGCPLSKKYTPRIQSIQKQFEGRGVAFLLVNPMESDSTEDARAETEKYGLTARYILDPTAVLGKALSAQRTTDVFLLDSRRTLIYRGAIDDQYGIGFLRRAPKRQFLKDALESLLAGRDVEVPATSAPGCELMTTRQTAPQQGVTWHGQVSRIFQRNCEECHREDENAPFELRTHEDVRANRAMIERVVGNRTMPPWFADRKVGLWRNSRSLSEADRKAVLGWIEGGCPEGDADEAPVARNWSKGWKLGNPDAILQIPRPIAVPAEGVVRYKYARVRTSFAEDRWIRSMEIRASEPQVVHHVLVFILYPDGHPRAREQRAPRGGRNGYFAGMVPGQPTMEFPKDTAKFLPAGADLIFQIHYTPNGVACEDQTKLGLFFYNGTPKHEIEHFGYSTLRIRIPPGEANHKIVVEKPLRSKMRILGYSPHMHLRGKAFLYEIVNADGSTKPLLHVPRYDFNWQIFYMLSEPLDLPKGTTLRCTAWYDNSRNNPANPDPTKTVRFGEQAYNEMMIGYFIGHKLD